uniref:Uncharacterized protein n=1 Tax=Arundo donax TaxID=35708 RepID=A0A0A8YI66_ARUDO
MFLFIFELDLAMVMNVVSCTLQHIFLNTFAQAI